MKKFPEIQKLNLFTIPLQTQNNQHTQQDGETLLLDCKRNES
jgi:hypothetical protein